MTKPIEVTSLKKTHIFWFSGLSGSGKSTIVEGVYSRIKKQGFLCTVLDGDDIRRKHKTQLSFSREDIFKNNIMIAKLCKDLFQKVDLVFVPIISPHEQGRQYAQSLLGKKNFSLIYLATSLETVINRDVKGLYKKAKEGSLKNMIGFCPNTPFEVPLRPALRLTSDPPKKVQENIDSFFNFVIKKIKN